MHAPWGSAADRDIFGTPFLTWRGSSHPHGQDCRKSKDQTSKILLLRSAKRSRAWWVSFSRDFLVKQSPGLSVRFMGSRSTRALASYLVRLYCSASVLTDDAIGLLEDVDVGSIP